MKISNYYSSRIGDTVLKTKQCHIEIQQAIESCPYKLKKGAPADIKKHIVNNLTALTWADKVKVGNSRLTINFLKDKIGVCFQIGNVARTYADILKLNYLYHHGIIEVGVIIVPHGLESKMLGANYASFERLKKEIILFQNEIVLPVVIYGISN
ncbi:MAG: hypothetical protein ACI9JN_000149 [Bacteroidia bacterium]|jgi:hypothetical protein